MASFYLYCKETWLSIRPALQAGLAMFLLPLWDPVCMAYLLWNLKTKCRLTEFVCVQLAYTFLFSTNT